MKKLFALIVGIVYLTSSVGATVELHYCMDKLVNWSLSGKDGNKCDNCGMEKDGGCCKDENKFVKNSLDQRAAESSIQATQTGVAFIPSSFIDGNELLFVSLLEKSPIGHSPPVRGSDEIYLFNCVFRI